MMKTITNHGADVTTGAHETTENMKKTTARAMTATP